VKQWLYEVDKNRKAALLSHLIRNKGWDQVLVFTRTRDGADRLVAKLDRDGISAAAIHGDKSQEERIRALTVFKEGEVRILVATDIVARGIDINELPQVINFDLPKVPEDYIHRIGRTGRAGLQGEGISLVSADEVQLLAAIESLLRRKLVREVETGFIPTHNVPLTREMKVEPKKPKKPKKPKQIQAQVSEEVRKIDGRQKSVRNRPQPRRADKAVDADKVKEATPRNKESRKTRRGAASRKKH
jgi:ATP-dependent RNA helicase RhlE